MCTSFRESLPAVWIDLPSELKDVLSEEYSLRLASRRGFLRVKSRQAPVTAPLRRSYVNEHFMNEHFMNEHLMQHLFN